ncbi:hypothetical protein NYE69_26250 [Paenibacillus sp. FSL R5-0527]|uniref:hypothetical protein n=1 Tax=Paenibacillus sp. FSL R5-0527 TaxID=2975321 RepID=UPI00097A9AC2|nr:hypothetical protein BK140_10370 [Paenibacillus macerans]
MSTRAVVIDSRVDGKGFWVWVYQDRIIIERYPVELAELGVILRNLSSKGKSIEQIYNEFVPVWTEYTRQLLAWTVRPMPDINKRFGILTPEQVEVAKKSGIKGLWDGFRIGAEYIYHIRQDGVYVTGVRIPKLRRV